MPKPQIDYYGQAKRVKPQINYGQTPEEETPQQPQQQAAPPPPPQGGTPTNFVNFAQRFNANKDVATREAGKYANQATAAVGKAAGSLRGAQKGFAIGVNTGSVAPPPGSNAPAATNTGSAAPLSGAPLPGVQVPLAPIQVTPPTQTSQAIVGESTRPAAANSQALSGESTRPGGDAASMADMLAKAGQKYTGPMGLDTAQPTIDANAADQQLNALKTSGGIQALVNAGGNSGSPGADALSGSLIGAAGRQNFDALRAKFNPNKDLLDAQTAAMKTAADAKKSSEDNAAAWGKVGGAAPTPGDDPSSHQASPQAAYDAAIADLPVAGGGGFGDGKGKTWAANSPEEQDKFAKSIVAGVAAASSNGVTQKGFTGGGAQGLTVEEVKAMLAAMPPQIYERFVTTQYAGNDPNPAHRNSDGNNSPQARMIRFLLAMKAAGGVAAGQTNTSAGKTRSESNG